MTPELQETSPACGNYSDNTAHFVQFINEADYDLDLGCLEKPLWFRVQGVLHLFATGCFVILWLWHIWSVFTLGGFVTNTLDASKSHRDKIKIVYLQYTHFDSGHVPCSFLSSVLVSTVGHQIKVTNAQKFIINTSAC